MPALLFVDDDLDLLHLHSKHFKRLGYEVLCAENAYAAMRILTSVTLSCAIIDIAMPGGDGFELCQRLREQSAVPVIFLSALTEAQIRVKSFLSGGDDYLAKPYDIKELELRIAARISGASAYNQADILKFGELQINIMERRVIYSAQNGKREGEFTSLQFDVLVFLARHPNQVFSYEQIYDRVWKTPIMGSRHNLQVIMATVRQKLATLCEGKNYIQTISRKGYRFVAQVQDTEEEAITHTEE